MDAIRADPALDETDLRLVALLKDDARAPLTRLAERLGLAASTVHARLTRLVEQRVITRFTVDLAPEALGYTTEALVAVRLRPGARGQLTAFAEQLRRLPQVVEYFYLAGADDFVIHFRGRTNQELRDFVTDNLSTQPIVAATNTSLVFERGLGPLGP